ncbi:MAG: cytochrome P450 [Cyanobacteria bacterium P01_H01_bin.15]
MPDSPAFQFNLFDKTFQRDPYPIFTQLRSTDPIHRSLFQAWTITRYDDVQTLLRDDSLAAAEIPNGIAHKSVALEKKGQSAAELAESGSNFLFFMNPPNHGRLRSQVLPAFNNKTLQALVPYVEKIVAERLAELRPLGAVDIVTEFAEYIPSLAIGHLMGLPPEDRALIHSWATTMSRIFDPLLTLKQCVQMNDAAKEFVSYLREQLTQRRRNPGDDILSVLLKAETQGEGLSERELIDLCLMAYSAADQTTVAAIASGIWLLLRHPEQLAKLQANPSLAASAADEVLRYEAPVQFVMRIAVDPLEMRGKTSEPGSNLEICLGAANRDPEMFPEPDRFDITRPNSNRNLAFAAGMHGCIGGSMARLELKIALREIVKALPQMAINTDTLTWRDNIVIRSLRSLPITWQI